MGLRKILTDKDPALHKVCRPVEKFDWRLHKLLDDMAETLEEAQGGALVLVVPKRVPFANDDAEIFRDVAIFHIHAESADAKRADDEVRDNELRIQPDFREEAECGACAYVNGNACDHSRRRGV